MEEEASEAVGSLVEEARWNRLSTAECVCMCVCVRATGPQQNALTYDP